MQAIMNADSSGFWGFVFIPSLSFFFFPFCLELSFLSPCFEIPKKKTTISKIKHFQDYISFSMKNKISIKNSTLSVFKNIANQCIEMLKFPDQRVHFKGYCLINTELIKSGNNTDNNQLETFYLYI